MSTHQQSTAAWRLRHAQVCRLIPARATTLQVQSGWLWLTRTQADAAVPDVWLTAGDTLELPAGSDWVAEAWAPAGRGAALETRFALVARSGWWQGWARWAARWRGRQAGGHGVTPA